jgi:hypothetical protein
VIAGAENDSPAKVSAPLACASVGGAMVTECEAECGGREACAGGVAVCAHARTGAAIIAIANKTPRIPASTAQFKLLLGRQGRPHKGQWKTSTTSAF